MNDKIEKKAGDFCWVELWTTDISNAKDFYSQLLGWNIESQKMPEGAGEYHFLKLGDSPIAGAFELTAEMQEQKLPALWSSYILVDSVDESTKKARELGAEICKEPFDIGEFGRMSVLLDPTGASISLWETFNKEQNAHLPSTTPGNVCWFELATNDFEKAGEFYCALFGWEKESKEMQDGLVYHTFKNDGEPVAGMYPITDKCLNQHPNWSAYFTVSDLNASLEKAKELGGKVAFDPITCPEIGTFTTVVDPQNVSFCLFQYNPEHK